MGKKNLFRYRGYYFDAESGMYYLQSRYYDPEIRRFISADEYISIRKEIYGYNMFLYCGENPVSRCDDNGMNWFSSLLKGCDAIRSYVGKIFGAGSSTTTTVAEEKMKYDTIFPWATVEEGVKITKSLKKGDFSKPITFSTSSSVEHPIKSFTVNMSLFGNYNLSFGLGKIGLSNSYDYGKQTVSQSMELNFIEENVSVGTAGDIKWDNLTDTHYTNVNFNFYDFIKKYFEVVIMQPSYSIAIY